MKPSMLKLFSILLTVAALALVFSFSPDGGKPQGVGYYNNYKVISAYDIGSLESRVNSEMVSGWQPMGGVGYSDSKGEYLQAVVR